MTTISTAPPPSITSPTNESTTISDATPYVGILALEVYTPRTYLRQSDLETHMGVPSGKFTIGLGQEGLAVTGDVEDINSIALTVVHSLLDKYQIKPQEVGRLEVGTETLVDKSKSTKTVLMQLFGENTDIEGATIVNACYGGTAALFNAMAWCESSGWDGRYAIVVAADIATYAAGPARPTCGVAAVAVLVGRDAPLHFDPKLRATHAAHVWDFYKPNHAVEYPTVDGALSQQCYYRALEDVYPRFCDKVDRYLRSTESDVAAKMMDCTTPDYFVFHAPYNKLVQKSYARLFLQDARRYFARYPQPAVNDENNHSAMAKHISHNSSNGSGDLECSKADHRSPTNGNMDGAAEQRTSRDENKQEDSPTNGLVPVPKPYFAMLQDWIYQNDASSDKIPPNDYEDKALEAVLKQISKAAYEEKVSDANYASKHVGNTYTASVFLGLCSLLDRAGTRGGLTPGKFITVFSYGSGALASMYALQVREPVTQSKFTISSIIKGLNLTERLEQRELINAVELDYALDTRAAMHTTGAPYIPLYPWNRLFPGTYYLTSIDEKWRRSYARVPNDVTYPPLGSPLAPLCVIPSTNVSQSLSQATSEPVPAVCGSVTKECIVTGVSAALPGEGSLLSDVNTERLLRGENLITPVSDSVKCSMRSKKMIQFNKKLNQSVPLEADADMIQLAAQIDVDALDLTKQYGVPESLANTMDTVSQVAVAAGLEALKNAGLVSGKSASLDEWQLPPQYRDTTGVVYATSFPAMDAVVKEVTRYHDKHSSNGKSSLQLNQEIYYPLMSLRDRLLSDFMDGDNNVTLSLNECDCLKKLLQSLSLDESCVAKSNGVNTDYAFDRKFLFRVLVLANAQLAQLVGCRGPNTQTNAACAGTTQAIAIAQDMLVTGRAQRVVVISSDDASGEILMPWLGSGFRILGAATNKSIVEEAAVPFDKRRSGMILGAGGIGLVLETSDSVQARIKSGLCLFKPQARLLGTHYCNSAYHGAALDPKHIASELNLFLTEIERCYGITRADIASRGVYFSHETCTHASDASSCAANEVYALRQVFGSEAMKKLIILNTKGFTGHPMGVSFEDVTAVACLLHQRIPPMANYQIPDEYLGELNLSQGGHYDARYALRFAGGFGSQVAFALYASTRQG